MKRHISILSLLALLSAGLLTVYAKTDVSVDDWDDDDDTPGNVTVEFIAVPKAEYADLLLTLTADPKATVMWTTEKGLLPEASEGWHVYKAPLHLTEDCTVSYYATLRKGACSETGTYVFRYADHQAAAPVLTPNAEGSLLTMTTSVAGAQIRYTADGTEPTATSALYTAPLEVTSYVYRAKVFAKGLFPSETVDYIAGGSTQIAPVPTAVFENLHLTISCSDPAAEIRYTLNTDASPADDKEWSIYHTPLALTENCLVRFFSRKEGCDDSDVQSFAFILSNFRAADPTIERDAAGTHIVMETTTEGGEIRYTTDETEPTEQSTLYTGPIAIEGNCTYTAKTFAPGLFESKANRYVVSNMAVSVPFVQFGDKLFSLICLDPLAEIRYTTDPDASTENPSQWILYRQPFALTENCTLRFFTRRLGFNDSDVESLTVVYSDYQNIAPTIERNDRGTHVVMKAVAQLPPSGYVPDDGSDPVLAGPQIRYTSDGSEPTAQSMLYTAPVRITPGAVYRARVFDANFYDSEITEYTIGNSTLPVPVAEFKDFHLTLTCSDEDAGIWYTTNPDATHDHIDDWTPYTAPIPLTKDCSYRFFSGDDDDNASDIQSFVFQKTDYTVAAPTVERGEDGMHVEMECATPGADIRYTTDGSEPTEESTLYTEPVVLTRNATFRAKAFLEGLYDSETTDFVVNNMAVPVAYASVVDKHLVLTCGDAEAEIWYTNDAQATAGDMTAWTLYTAPVALSANADFHFFCRRDGLNDSDIETFIFLKANHQVATPAVERSEDGAYIVMTCADEGAEIRYTTDGTDPTAESELYTEPVFVQGNTTFRAIAMAEGLFDSAITEYIVSNMIVMEPYAVFENLRLTLAIGDPEAEIWYAVKDASVTRDTDEWRLYKEPIMFTGDCTVSYFGRRAGYNNSETKTFTLVYADHQADMPEVVVTESGDMVEILSEVEDGVVRYTIGALDAPDPDENSPVYEGPIALKDGPNTIKARVFADGLFPSEVDALSVDYRDPVSVESVKASEGIVYAVRNGVKGFVASEPCQLPIYNAQGVCVVVVQLHEGFNPLPALTSGIHIAAGVKILL